MALLDPDGQIIDVNDAVERRGFHRDEFRGRHIADTPYFAADSSWQRTWAQRLEEAARLGTPCGYDDVITSLDGQVRYAEATVTPILDKAGKIDSFLVEAEDTTERLQVELALREGERRVHDLLATLPVLAWSMDAAGVCEFVNQRWLDVVGSVPTSSDRPDWAAVFHPDDLAEFRAAWARAVEFATALAGCFRVIDVMGEARWFDIRIAPVLGDDGNVVRWSGAALELVGREPHELPG
jgi:PAS domain S-box-containing protein